MVKQLLEGVKAYPDTLKVLVVATDRMAKPPYTWQLSMVTVKW
jgi:hypothetical protein